MGQSDIEKPTMMFTKILIPLLSLLIVVKSAPKEVKTSSNDGEPEAERVMEAEDERDGVNDLDNVDLKETSAEAIGDRIMEEMNGMKEKFDTALSRIGEEISKDEAEQNEMSMKS